MNALSLNDVFIILLISSLIDGAIGCFIDRIKNGTHRGFWLGVLLGPLGLVIAAVLPGNPKKETEEKQDEDRAFPGMDVVSPPRLKIHGHDAEPLLRPKRLSDRLTLTCNCGYRLDLSGLSEGRYECPACHRHFELVA